MAWLILGRSWKTTRARPDVCVAHFAVSHLPFGQAHIQAGGLQLAEGVLGEEIVQLGGGSGLHGVARDILAQGKAVHDDECCRSFHKTFSLGSRES